MSTFATRLLYRVAVTNGATMDLTQALDLLLFREIDIVVNIHEAGVGASPTLVLEHAPANESGTYLPFATPVSVPLDSAGSSWVRVSSFTRWVSWRTTGTLDTPATVTVDILARD